MSNAGRPPIPSSLKWLRGTVQSKSDEPTPDAAIYVPPPRELADHPYASEFWEVHLELLVKHRMITEVDMTAFAAACLSYEGWIKAEEQLAKPEDQGGGHTLKTQNGYMIQSPWVSIAAARRKEFLEFLREFGLTPASRTRIKVQFIGAPGAGSERDEDQLFFQF